MLECVCLHDTPPPKKRKEGFYLTLNYCNMIRKGIYGVGTAVESLQVRPSKRILGKVILKE
jgi:hypothetical protein